MINDLFIKRRFYNSCFYFIIPYKYKNFGAFFREFGFYVAHAYCLLQGWRLGPGGYFSNFTAVGINNFIIVAGDTALYHFKTDQLTFYTFLFLLQQRRRVVELFIKLCYPS